MNPSRKNNDRLLVAMTFMTFTTMGVPDGVLGVAWPSMRGTFGVPLEALGALLTAFTIGFLLSSFNGGRIVSRIGVGRLLLIGNLSAGAGFLGYVLAPSWQLMLASGFLTGFGAGATDSGLNTHIADHHSTRMVNWFHACFGLGATIGPVVMTAILTLGYSWRYGYALLVVLRVLLALAFALTLGRWHASEPQPDAGASRRVSVGATLSLLLAWLGITMCVLQTGIEITAGQWSYSLFTLARSVPPQVAGIWVSVYWGSLTAGRVLVGFVSDRAGPVRLVRACAVGLLVGSLLLTLNVANAVSFLGLVIVGLSIAPVFPTLVSATPGRVGALHAANAMGFQVSAASLGGALIPGAAGVAAQRFGLEVIGPILIVITLITFGVNEVIARRMRAPSAATAFE